MDVQEIRRVIDVWAEQYADLSRRDFIRAITIFENKGAMMGCSNPHPHGQIWSTQAIPAILEKELNVQTAYYQSNHSSMLLNYLEWELGSKERLLAMNDSFAALVSHWAIWPFETLVLPRRPVQRITELNDRERQDWAEILKRLLVQYDNLFQTSFPYSMGIHQALSTEEDYPGVLMHQHFFPPLLRSATIKKFQVGYEMSGEPQRDITAEQAAERLRSLPKRHYREKD